MGHTDLIHNCLQTLAHSSNNVTLSFDARNSDSAVVKDTTSKIFFHLARLLTRGRELKKVLDTVAKIRRLTRNFLRAVCFQVRNTTTEMHAVHFTQLLQVNFLSGEIGLGGDGNNVDWKSHLPTFEVMASRLETTAAAAGGNRLFKLAVAAASAQREGALRKVSELVATTNKGHGSLRAAFSGNLGEVSKHFMANFGFYEGEAACRWEDP